MKKHFYLALTIVTIIYSLLYAALGGFIGNAGALSKIGLVHRTEFFIWGILTYFTLTLNIINGFRKTKYKFYIGLLVVSFIGMMLTLLFDFDYSKHGEYMAHCIGSLTFSAVMGITVFLMFLLSKRYILAVVTASILLLDLTLLIMYKETAFNELFPIFSGYVLMTINNYKREEIYEAEQEVANA